MRAQHAVEHAEGTLHGGALRNGLVIPAEEVACLDSLEQDECL